MYPIDVPHAFLSPDHTIAYVRRSERTCGFCRGIQPRDHQSKRVRACMHACMYIYESIDRLILAHTHLPLPPSSHIQDTHGQVNAWRNIYICKNNYIQQSHNSYAHINYKHIYYCLAVMLIYVHVYQHMHSDTRINDKDSRALAMKDAAERITYVRLP